VFFGFYSRSFAVCLYLRPSALICGWVFLAALLRYNLSHGRSTHRASFRARGEGTTDRRYTKEKWSDGVVEAPRSFYSRLFACIRGCSAELIFAFLAIPTGSPACPSSSSEQGLTTRDEAQASGRAIRELSDRLRWADRA
jgi:hypothetical protein